MGLPFPLGLISQYNGTISEKCVATREQYMLLDLVKLLTLRYRA